DQGDEVSAGPIQMRFHDVRHESSGNDGVERIPAALQHALRHGGSDPVGRRGHPERAGQGGTAQVVRWSSEHGGSMQSSRVGCNPEMIGSSSCNGAEIAAACDYRRWWRGPEPGRRGVTIIVQTAGGNQLGRIARGPAGGPPTTKGSGPGPGAAGLNAP